MQLFIVLNILILVFDLYLGTQLPALYAIGAFPLVFVVSGLLGIVISIHLYKVIWNKKKTGQVIQSLRLLLHLLIPFIYIIVSVAILYLTITVTHKYNDKQYSTKTSQEQTNQYFDSVKVGSIKQIQDDFIFSCEKCGYQLSFPKSWGFKQGNEVKISSNVETIPQSKASEAGPFFRLVTPNYFSDPAMGAIFDIASFYDKDKFEYIVSNLGYLISIPSNMNSGTMNINNITINFVMVLNGDKLNHNQGYAWFYADSKLYVIYVNFASTKDFEDGLKTILEGYKTIN